MPHAVVELSVPASSGGFSLDDRHRSIRRFVMNALDSPPWRVRTERQPVADEDRPVAVIEVAAPLVRLSARTSIPQGDVQRQQTFGVVLYPVIEDSAAEARHTAALAAERLANAIEFGLVDDEGELLTAPEMMPVYSFVAVPVKGVQRQGPSEPYGWMRVEDFPVRTIQDPEDPLRWTVTCDLRVSWWQGGRERPAAPLVGDGGLSGTWQGP